MYDAKCIYTKKQSLRIHEAKPDKTEGGIDSSVKIVIDFNTFFPTINGTARQKTNKEIKVVKTV